MPRFGIKEERCYRWVKPRNFPKMNMSFEKSQKGEGAGELLGQRNEMWSHCQLNQIDFVNSVLALGQDYQGSSLNLIPLYKDWQKPPVNSAHYQVLWWSQKQSENMALHLQDLSIWLWSQENTWTTREQHKRMNRLSAHMRGSENWCNRRPLNGKI